MTPLNIDIVRAVRELPHYLHSARSRRNGRQEGKAFTPEMAKK